MPLIQAWSDLHDPDLGDDVVRLVAVLDRVAAVRLEQRWPLLEAVRPWLAHPNPRVRAAALAATGGACGVPAWTDLNEALGDGDLRVREAALDAFARSAHDDPTRWVLALFHRRDAVREGALARLPSTIASWLWVRGLGDPANRGAALARLRRGTPRPALLPMLLEHVEAGHLEQTDGADLIGRLDWVRDLPALVSELHGHRHPKTIPTRPEEVRAWLGDAVPAPRLDAVVDLLCFGVSAGLPTCVGVAQALVERAMRDALHDAADVLATSLARRVVLAGRTLPLPLRIVAATRIPALVGALGDPTSARQTLRGLAAFRRNGAARTTLAELGLQSLVRTESGLDLRSAAGLAAITEDDSLVGLLDAFGADRLVEAATHEPVGAALLLAPPKRKSPADAVRTQVVRGVIAADTPAAAMLLARLALQRPSLKLPRLDKSALPALVAAVHLLDADARDRLLKSRAQSIVAHTWAESSLPHASLLRALLEDPAEPGPVARSLLGELVTRVGRASVLRLPHPAFMRLLALDEAEPLMPWAVQQDLVAALSGHRVRVFAEWAARHAPDEASVPAMPPSTGRRALTPKEAGRITGSASLDAAVAPALASPVTGLLRALAGRPRPTPSAVVCAALLLCHDPLEEVATALPVWGYGDPTIREHAEQILLTHARTRTDLGPAAGAVLYRWPQPHDSFIAWLTAEAGRPAQVLRSSLALPSPALRAALWSAARHMVGRWRWHHTARLRELADDDLVRVLVDTLGDRGAARRPLGGFPADKIDQDTIVGEAAGIFARLATIRGLGAFRAEVEALRGDLPPEAQRALARWLMTTGEVVPPPAAVGEGRALTEDPEAILAGTDGAALARLVAAPQRGTAELAVLRLVELGSWSHLADALLDPEGPHPDLVSETLPHWADEAALARIEAAAADVSRPAPIRFHAALGLTERAGDPGPFGDLALEAAAAPDAHFVRAADVQRLTDAFDEPLRVARALVDAPAFAAYSWSVGQLAAHWPDDAAERLRRFLLHGPSRVGTVRLTAARELRDNGDSTGVVLVVDDAMDQARRRRSGTAAAWARGWDADIVEEITRAALRAGDRFAPGDVLVEGLFTGGVRREAIEPACAAILEQASRPPVQRRALDGLPTRLARTERAQRLAHLFLWGRDQARKLLQRRFEIRYLVGEDLGLTRLEHRAIYVNPLPVLRGERNGEAVVRGLIVHELGHHLYNADPEGLRIWTRANERNLARLHNLVCDEHLERNLRGVDPAYGDDLKKLGAWAFLHARRTIAAQELLRLLGPAAAAVLVPTPLAPARARGHVSIPLGRLFHGLEASGSSFSRFFRALRMGLGDRHGDPLVREALDLFGKDFRDLDNPGLWQVTLKLAELFAGHLGILDVTDVHATAAGEEGDDPAEGRGVTNEDVQREVKRIDGTKDGIGRKPTLGKVAARSRGADTVNVGTDDAFNRIEHVKVLQHDPAEHASLARDVARDARHLSDAFARLGLQYRWVGPRVRGTRLDRARLLGASLRGDPRVLRARRREHAADLHLSVVVDCSGSMQGDRMERARRMATLLAEACRGLDGVDLRLFGFTDSVIYDAGDDQRCAAHALEAGGGNNDAAGLLHAAQVALASRRRARLVVMISDGLPTECTTAALAGLVRRLRQRHHLPSAQIAVAPIAERCFDTYLEVLDDDTQAAVRRFGALVTDLVARTIRG